MFYVLSLMCNTNDNVFRVAFIITAIFFINLRKLKNRLELKYYTLSQVSYKNNVYFYGILRLIFGLEASAQIHAADQMCNVISI